MKHLLQNRLLNVLVKVLLMAGLLFVLYRQLFANEKMAVAYRHFLDTFDGDYALLGLVVVFMVLNWGIETVKWKLLIDRIHPLSWLDAVEGILFGVTFSLFTPSRIGEFGGRVFALNTDRKQAIVSTLLGSVAQIVINLSLGSLGLVLYALYFKKADAYLLTAFIAVYLLMIAAIHFGYYNLDVVSRKFSRFPVLKRIRKYIHIVELYPSRTFLILEGLSALRYVVYCLQFVLLLEFFGFVLPLHLALILVASMFFVQTINPINIALIDFGFRGNVAAYFLLPFTDNPIAILATTISLWFINLIVPAMIGGISALRFRFFNGE